MLANSLFPLIDYHLVHQSYADSTVSIFFKQRNGKFGRFVVHISVSFYVARDNSDPHCADNFSAQIGNKAVIVFLCPESIAQRFGMSCSVVRMFRKFQKIRSTLWITAFCPLFLIAAKSFFARSETATRYFPIYLPDLQT